MADHLVFEAVQAHEGDCLLLRYGPQGSPRLVIIDGGPGDTYRSWLRPRLDQLRGDDGGPLAVELVMVSHIDDDHIIGIIGLCEDILAADGDPPVTIRSLWHNSFADLTGNEEVPEGLRAAASLPWQQEWRSILYAAPSGRTLRQLARRLELPLNAGQELITDTMEPVSVPGGLKLTVLAPNQARIDQLRKQWEKELRKRTLAPSTELTPSNLSSMVVLAEYRRRRILLTGDAHQDDILGGLANAKLLDSEQPLHLDILKVPHHGSDKNVSTEFFRLVTADHYVVSGDGEYDNPDLATIEMLAEARGDDPYTLWLTNDEKRLEPVLGDRAKRTIEIRSESALSIAVSLDVA